MAADYSQAAFPSPFQILGLRLKPFCLGHFWLMDRFGSAFVSLEDNTATEADVVLGILICSMSYEDFLDFLDEPDFLEKVRAWGKKCRRPEINIDKCCKLFADYIARATRQPVVIFEDEGKPTGAHWSQTIYLSLIEMGYSPRDATNLPLGRAFADFYKHAENLGVLTIADETTTSTIRELEGLCPT